MLGGFDWIARQTPPAVVLKVQGEPKRVHVQVMVRPGMVTSVFSNPFTAMTASIDGSTNDTCLVTEAVLKESGGVTMSVRSTLFTINCRRAFWTVNYDLKCVSIHIADK